MQRKVVKITVRSPHSENAELHVDSGGHGPVVRVGVTAHAVAKVIVTRPRRLLAVWCGDAVRRVLLPHAAKQERLVGHGWVVLDGGPANRVSGVAGVVPRDALHKNKQIQKKQCHRSYQRCSAFCVHLRILKHNMQRKIEMKKKTKRYGESTHLAFFLVGGDDVAFAAATVVAVVRAWHLAHKARLDVLALLLVVRALGDVGGHDDNILQECKNKRIELKLVGRSKKEGAVA